MAGGLRPRDSFHANGRGVRLKIFYHVTLKRNLEKITQEGLIPAIGPLSQGVETEPAVFLFNSAEDMDTALSGWLGAEIDDLYGEEEPLACLRVKIPDGYLKKNPDLYESVCRRRIEPCFIEFIREE